MSVTIDLDGGLFRPANGDTVDLSRRPSLRRILAHLARVRQHAAGRPVTVPELIETGWPGEVMIRESGNERVYTAIRTLRRLGLQGVLLTRDGGYLLDPTQEIEPAAFA